MLCLKIVHLCAHIHRSMEMPRVNYYFIYHMNGIRVLCTMEPAEFRVLNVSEYQIHCHTTCVQLEKMDQQTAILHRSLARICNKS